MYKDIKIPFLYSESIEPLTRDNVLKKINEYKVYAYYIGKDFSINRAIESPLRKDSHPSFSIYYNKNKRLKYKDHATGDSGDVFNFIQAMFNCSFYEALIKINIDFNLNLNFNEVYNNKSFQTHKGFISKKVVKYKKSSFISIKVRKWNKQDASYWLSYNINSRILKLYNVFPLERVYLNDTMYYYNNTNNPCYCYIFYKDDNYTYKIYKPLERNKTKKWLSNVNRTVLQGYSQLPEKDEILIITKALKDVMVLYSLGYSSIAMQNEISTIKDSVMEEFKSRFKRIYILQDFDLAGIKGTNKFRKLYPFVKYIFIQNLKTKNNGLKDISDYIKEKGIEQTKLLLNKLLK